MHVLAVLAVLMTWSPDDPRIPASQTLPAFNKHYVECNGSWVVSPPDTSGKHIIGWVEYSTWLGFMIGIDRLVTIDAQGVPHVSSSVLDSASMFMSLHAHTSTSFAPLPEAWRTQLHIPVRPSWSRLDYPDTSDAWLSLASIANDVKRHHLAERYVRKAHPQLLANIDHQLQLGIALLGQHRRTDALHVLRAAAAMDSTRYDVMATLGHAYTGVMDSSNAVRCYRAALKRCPPEDREMILEISYMMSVLYAECGDRKAFHRWAGRIDRLAPPSSSIRMLTHATEALVFGTVDSTRVIESFEVPRPVANHFPYACEGKWVFVRKAESDTMMLGYVMLHDTLGWAIGTVGLVTFNDHGVARLHQSLLHRSTVSLMSLMPYLDVRLALVSPQWTHDLMLPLRPRWVQPMGTAHDSLERKLRLAEQYLAQGKHEYAASMLYIAYDRSPQDVRIATVIGAAKLGLREYQGARNLLEKAAMLAPSQWRPQMLLGDLCVAELRHIKALEHYRTAFRNAGPSNQSMLAEIAIRAIRTCTTMADHASLAEWKRLAEPLAGTYPAVDRALREAGPGKR